MLTWLQSIQLFENRSYVVVALDIVQLDPTRSRALLLTLERLIRRDVEIVLTSRRSPFRLLHHPERHPEYRSDQALTASEVLRWDRVMANFCLHGRLNQSAESRTEHEILGDYHAAWKLCTTGERVLLYQLANGRIVHSQNSALEELDALRLIAYEPWPKIADAGFAKFVRTAEPPKVMSAMHRSAGQASHRIGRIVVVLMLLIAAIGISWAAGNTLKFATGILVAALAFVGQITQAISLVRGNGSAGK